MIQTVTEHDFIRAFEAVRPENFSRPALVALFDRLEDLERDTGEQYALDVIALCCEWSEMTADEVREQYPDCWREDADDLVDALNGATHAIRVEHFRGDDTFLVLDF